MSSYRNELRKIYYKESGKYKSKNGSPTWDYAKWLEDIIISLGQVKKIKSAYKDLEDEEKDKCLNK